MNLGSGLVMPVPAAENPGVTVIDDSRLAFGRLVHRDLDLAAYFDAADRALRRQVPFDASCWLGLDPATLLPTAHFTREYGVDDLLAMAANEYLDEDYNKFAGLSRAARPVGILSIATGGDVRRSRRHATFLAPHGFTDGDELRAVFRDGDAAWGAIAIHRRQRCFDERDAERVAAVGAMVAHGIRRAMLRSALASTGESGTAGLILLRGDDTIEAITPRARQWLEDLFDSTSAWAEPPLMVVSLAQQARRAGRGATDEIAWARLPRRSGGWVRADASVLDDEARVAVVISPGVEPGLAELITQAYGLTAREREIATLTLRGLSTREMAASLKLSPYTVQDHLKSIFEKVGVRSRGELAAQLFLRQCVPQIAANAPDWAGAVVGEPRSG
jgi:DNA-binding CsgD family transcriptional regulator